MNKQKRKGFTIVELVIVIAVIAILSAVLIPTFSGVVNNANDSANTQRARNAYVEYVSTVTDGKIESDVIVGINTDNDVEMDAYYKVKDGIVGDEVDEADLSGYCVITADKVWKNETHVNNEGGAEDAEGNPTPDNKCDKCGATVSNN